MVRWAGTGREHRGDPRRRRFDSCDGGPGRGGSRRRDLRRPVSDHPGRASESRAIQCSRPRSTRSHRRRIVAVEVSIRSGVPAGCGAGTSAAVAVALLGALAAVRSEQWSPRDVAYAAHRLEVGVARCRERDPGSSQRGVRRDQLPRSRAVPGGDGADAARPGRSSAPLLTLIFLGRAHDSSDVHRQVIEDGLAGQSAFSRLRDAAVAARDAVARPGSPRVRSGHDRQHRRASVAAR